LSGESGTPCRFPVPPPGAGSPQQNCQLCRARSPVPHRPGAALVRRSIVRLSVVHALAEHSPASTAGFAADRRVHPDPAGHAHADGSCVPDTTAAPVGANEGARLSSYRAEQRRGLPEPRRRAGPGWSAVPGGRSATWTA